MNFTREPIIETIITPKDGYKLLVRNSKGGGQQEEHYVDALEVVSFGHSFFFRSLERPKSFLVPVSDYEVVEVKETRVVLKNAGVERSIKIGGGRDAPIKREQPEKVAEASEGEEIEAGEEMPSRPEATGDQRNDKKRDRRRHRRRRGGGSEDRQEQREWNEKPKPVEDEFKSEPHAAPSAAEQGGGAHDETQVSSSMFSSLFPPPSTLISETIGRYKDFAVSEGSVLSKPVTETPKRQEEDSSDHEKNREDSSDSTHLYRTSTSETYESRFSSLPETRFFF